MVVHWVATTVDWKVALRAGSRECQSAAWLAAPSVDWSVENWVVRKVVQWDDSMVVLTVV
jgi:hypothetical protein